jgi:peptidoglycan L-alanyl-D-glutamate endopeptidase CwlK
LSGGLSREDVLFHQRLLKSAGLYTGDLDGFWGPKTDAAVKAFEALGRELRERYGELDSRSETSLRLLDLRAQEAARIFLRKVRTAGIDARLISGTRTYAEQNELFKKGRFGNPGPQVTKARGGQSNHNFGIAWDIGIFQNGKYLGDSPLYKKAAEAGLADGLEWGGNWIDFKDLPHYQLATGLLISEVRERFEKGRPFVEEMA